MKRRKFIQSVAAATAGAFAMPYILPSGRLFAQSQPRLAEHVVLVLFAGGVRQQESVLQGYLAQSQNSNWEGNILNNLMEGDAPDGKIVYGTDPQPGTNIPIPKVLDTTLEKQGTFFREMSSEQILHYVGLSSCLHGSNQGGQGMKEKPIHPTIFEYLRRHAGLPATKVWFVGNGIGASVPLLTHSMNKSYGKKYAANFLAPSITFTDEKKSYLQEAEIYHPENEMDFIYQMKYFLDNNFKNISGTLNGIGNTEEEKYAIKQFLDQTLLKTQNNAINLPPVADTNDLFITGYALEVMNYFKPNLTVVNFNDVDACHGYFTNYLRSLHRADHAVAHLWSEIQKIPEMAGNTIMLVLPECGRNLTPNPVRDANGWYGYDHTDANSARIFGMMAGPNVPANLSIGSPGNSIGMAVDTVPTIADILGIKNQVMNSGFIDPRARSLFDRI